MKWLKIQVEAMWRPLQNTLTEAATKVGRNKRRGCEQEQHGRRRILRSWLMEKKKKI